MAKEMAWCAYCGEYKETVDEHVLARCFALPEMEKSCNWVEVRACPKCNVGFSDVEPFVRGFATLINAPGETLVKDAMFERKVMERWRQPREKGNLARTLNMFRKPDGSGLSSLDDLRPANNLGIMPDENVLYLVRKIIRGLYFHHFTEKRRLPQVLQESQIMVEPWYDCPPEEQHEMAGWKNVHFIHEAVFGYAFAECDEEPFDLPGVDSFWLLNWCKGPIFAGLVKSNACPFIQGEAPIFKMFTM